MRDVAGSWVSRRLVMPAVLALALMVGAVLPAASAPAPEPDPALPPEAPDTVIVTSRVEAVTSRDSLLLEIRQHTELIRALRDSLSGDALGIQLTPEKRLALQQNIEDITQVVQQIGDELSRLEFQVKDNRISLLNESGEGIVINIPERLPENLDQQVTEGLKTLSQLILQELPDSLEIDQGVKWEWKSFLPGAPPPPRKILHGNQVALRDDIVVAADEDVRGDVVAVLGDARIDGRVDGDVVAVFGTLEIGPKAEVTGTVVGVGGRVERDPGARVGEVHSVDVFGEGSDLSVTAFLGQRALSFAVFQVLFLLLALLTVIAVVAAPEARFGAVTAYLRAAPGPSFGLGLALGVAGLLVLPLLLLILVVTFVGIPVALIVAVAVAGMGIVAVAAAASIVGERLCAGLGGGCPSPWVTALVGLAALNVVFFLGTALNAAGGAGGLAAVLMLLGQGVLLLAGTFGLGALVQTRFGGRRRAS